uniref:Aminoglycoside phosphotransferase domain-containing protein n=1 Tax=Latimeria chalumnae TaxID=7897 RepID=H3AJ60_LATCH
ACLRDSVMADTVEVRETHKFNQHSLERYLSNKIPGFPQSAGDTFKVRQYSSGQSNPTFYLQKGSREYVLRKKPPGPLLPGAHKIDREYRVQKALSSVGFPVPPPILYCDDCSVIGTEFYVMGHIQGRIFRDIALPGISPAERRALNVGMIETLARIHSFDYRALGLEGYGKGRGYCKRQVLTWRKQYQAAAHTDIPAMKELSDWLVNNLPANDNEATLVHGDFRIENIIFHPNEARVLAVLDWELSTIGHPVADLAYACMHYFWPTNMKFVNQTSFGSAASTEGIPSPEELISLYCQCRALSTPLPHWNFFLALAFFKMAGIAQGVYARHLLGNASAKNACEFGELVKPLAEVGLQFTKRRSSVVPLQLQSSHSRDLLFQQSAKGRKVLQQVKEFMKEHVFPAEQ